MKTILVFASFLLCLHCTNAADSIGWETFTAHKNGDKVLRKLPVVSVQSAKYGKVVIRVQNNTGMNLRYCGYGKNTPRMFIKEKRDGKWMPTVWDWCGTGLNEHVLSTQGTVNYELHVPSGAIQIFTVFQNAKDPKEFSLVKLYEKDDD